MAGSRVHPCAQGEAIRERWLGSSEQVPNLYEDGGGAIPNTRWPWTMVALLDLLARFKLTDVSDRIRVATETLHQQLIDAEATGFIGAGPFERSAERATHANGTRACMLTTTAGDPDLKIPKLRAGTFFPALLERRRRIDQALFAVVMEAYLHGVSSRKVDDLVKALSADTGISKPEVSRICAGLDAEIAQLRDRTLSALDYPYVFLDATCCTGRVNHRIVSQAIVVAVGVATDGRREFLGFDVGDTKELRVLEQFPAVVEGPQARRGEARHVRRPLKA